MYILNRLRRRRRRRWVFFPFSSPPATCRVVCITKATKLFTTTTATYIYISIIRWIVVTEGKEENPLCYCSFIYS